MKLDVQVTDLRIAYAETTAFSSPIPTFVRADTSCDVRIIINGKANAYETVKLNPDEEAFLSVLLERIATRVRADVLSE